jgi:hypothetical protein
LFELQKNEPKSLKRLSRAQNRTPAGPVLCQTAAGRPGSPPQRLSRLRLKTGRRGDGACATRLAWLAHLVSVVCRARLLFTCIGASTPLNALAIVYEATRAAAVASAICLILEFGRPYSTVFGISPEGVDLVIAELSANMPSSG